MSDLFVLVVFVVDVVRGSLAVSLLVLVVVVWVVIIAVVVTRVAFVVEAVAFQWAAFLLLIIEKISVFTEQDYLTARPVKGVGAGPFYPQTKAAALGPAALSVKLVDFAEVSQNTLRGRSVGASIQFPNAS